MSEEGELGEYFSNDYFSSAFFSDDHRFGMGISIISISCVLVVAPFLRHYVKTKSFLLSTHLVGMWMGIMVVLINQFVPTFAIREQFVNPYNLLVIYYTTMIAKFIYTMDSYVFVKSLSHILLISVTGWLVCVICFGFMLTTFGGALTSLTFLKQCLIGVLFIPMEMPSVLFNIEQVKLIEVVMTSESVITLILSTISLDILVGAMSGYFINWYQPIFVIIRMISVPVIIGVPTGLIAGCATTWYSNSSISTTLAILTSNFLLYHVVQFGFAGSGGLCCYIYMLLISRKRLEIAQQIDREIVLLIDMLFALISTMSSFVVVISVLPPFIENFSIMAMAVSLALFICTNACRLVFFISISPLLTRLGYGFNFRTLVTMVWCAKKGPMSFIMLSTVVSEGLDEVLPKELLLLGLIYIILTNAINEVSAWTTLKKIYISGDEFILAKTNMKNAFIHLEQKRTNQLAFMRMNRFYNDANWRIINEYTSIRPKYVDEAEKNMVEGKLKFEKKPPYCGSCKQVIEYEPSKREYREMQAEVHLRILHAARGSFVRQFECGLLDISALRMLNHYIDLAMESKDYCMKIDTLMTMMTEKHYSRYIEKLRIKMLAHDKAALKARYIPRFPTVHKIMTHWAFRTVFDIIVCVQLIIIIVAFIHERIALESSYLGLLICFYVEFLVMLIGCSAVKKSEAFKRYISRPWNKVDFALLILGTLDMTLGIILTAFIPYLIVSRTAMIVIGIMLGICHLLRFARVVRFFRWISKLQNAMVIYYDRRVDAKLRFVYSVGHGLVVAYEEVDEILHTLADEPKIVKDVRAELQKDRNKIAKQLGLIEMSRPCVPMSMKTRQTMLCTMTTMRNAVDHLRVEGLLDDYEHVKLHEIIMDTTKHISPIKMIPMTSPRSIFYETPWIGGDDKVFEYLFENVRLRVWGAHEVIYTPGDLAEGVYIIVSGMLKLVYNPSQTTLRDFRYEGLLPVKDRIRHAKFDFPTEEFIFKGNSIGELGVITGRPYCCEVMAEMPTQAFIISKQCITEALELSPDPVRGLYSRIWMHISSKFVKRLLRDVPMYSGASAENINAVMARSFIPKLDAYNIFRTNDTIEDIVLIEGTVIDLITQEIIVAPSLIPRGSPDLMIPDSYSLHPKPVLFIVPTQDMDPYEVMMFSEIISRVNENAASDCYLLKNEAFKRWQTGRQMHQSVFSLISNASRTRSVLSIEKMLASSVISRRTRELFSTNSISGGFFDPAEVNKRRMSEKILIRKMN